MKHRATLLLALLVSGCGTNRGGDIVNNGGGEIERRFAMVVERLDVLVATAIALAPKAFSLEETGLLKRIAEAMPRERANP